ncbi:Retrovirus-related Pol polyprotein from transposon RE1 [Vitis vinifera]|uniref:Retrovirus-related Pol polyprotein from transposon RE1 n=1 Tax=Vitis vinifera TaxID=29760 RepID=A0A438JFJ9_VITVI|nr:Retrovirus-related Pol polyprotein from transposon RE1 [Vitis vinifera]
MVENIKVLIFKSIWKDMTSFIRLLVPIHPSKMKSLNEKNRHLLEVVRASLIAAKTPISYWGEAITSAAYLINRGEYHKEIQTLDYDYHISEEDESGQSELVNQEVGELDMSGQQFGSEDVFTEIPNQSSSVEGVLNLEPDPFMKRLPHRHNREDETWELVECPPGKKPVGCRWIYTVKYKADGSIERFKARLVAKGCNLDWPLQQFDVKNVFLHGELSEEVYMDLPPGCMVSEKQCQKEIGMLGCQPVNTPIEEGLKLCVELNQVSTDKGRYQRLVGRLMYLAHTRPDLAYALSVVSQYMHNPREQHMNAFMRILRYLKNAPGKGILFAKNVDHQSIEVYTDADWAGAVDDRRSTSGYFTFVGGNLVTWKSKKQNVVARSSAEAEF